MQGETVIANARAWRVLLRSQPARALQADVSPAILREMLARWPEDAAWVVMVVRLPPGVLSDLCAHADPDVRARLAARTDLPPMHQVVLAADPAPAVREAIVHNLGATDAALAAVIEAEAASSPLDVRALRASRARSALAQSRLDVGDDPGPLTSGLVKLRS